MKHKKLSYIKHTFLPCFCLSGVAGVLTGCLIFFFKLAASRVIAFSERGFAFVRQEPRYLPLCLLGALGIGLLSALILRYAKDCRGGGIPTAVASIRALLPIRWVQSILLLFFSALLTYLGGLPLGNEGPSVQMGAAVGKGTTDLLGRKNRAWQRYIMTGGACAGFATATGAPLTGILFALEEVHRRFSPMIFMAAAVAVLSGTATQDALSTWFFVDTRLFNFVLTPTISLSRLPLVFLLGLFCGLAALGFTLVYKHVRRGMVALSRRLPIFVIIPAVFLLSALAVFFMPALGGSGHGIIEGMLVVPSALPLLLLIFLLRALLMMGANTAGVSGGTFLPILSFGAILGGLFGAGALALGLIPAESYGVLVICGMAAFLGVASRTPITAIAFAAEVLCRIEIILPVAIAVAVGYTVAEVAGVPSFNDTVMEGKIEAEREGKTPLIVDTHLCVLPGSFAAGREVRDILWPPTTAVLSIDRAGAPGTARTSALAPYDVLHIHYATYDLQESEAVFADILGHQTEGKTERHTASGTHTVPEG